MRYLMIVTLLLFSSSCFSQYQYYAKSAETSRDLWVKFREMKFFTATFYVFEPSIFKASGHVDVQHRGTYIPNKAVMVSMKLKINGRWLEGSKTGANIVNKLDHYQPLQVHGFKVLQPGVYTISVWMRSASDAAPGRNGIAEIKPGKYNQVVYEITPIR